MREPFDAREDSDGDVFVRTVLVHMQIAPVEGRLLVRAVPGGMGLAVGIACVLGVVLAWNPALSGLLVAGPLLLFSSGLQTVKSTQRSWRATQQWKKAKREHEAWLAERPAGEQVPPTP